MRELGGREPARDVAPVLDLDHAVEPGDQNDQRGYDECDQRADDGHSSLGEHDQDGQRPEPDRDRRRIPRTRMGDDIDRLGQIDRPFRWCAGEVGQLPEDDVDADAGQETEHHGMRHEAGVAAETKHAGHDHECARHDRQQHECLAALVGRQMFDAGSSRQRGGAGGRDHHQPRARRAASGDRTDEAGVQAVHGVDAGEDARGHAVGDAADRARQPGQGIGLDVLALGGDGAQPRHHGLGRRGVSSHATSTSANTNANPTTAVVPASGPPSARPSGTRSVVSSVSTAPPAIASTIATVLSPAPSSSP